MYRSPASARIVAGAALLALSGGALVGCSPAADGVTTITLSGPNQFTNDTDTFGAPWDKIVADFEKDNPDIKLETNVLPISEWAQTSSAQLTAGTAPELIFAQTPHTPDQISPLTDDLAKPNPFSETDQPWLDDFRGEYFGGDDALGINPNGDYEGVPFNLVAVGLYYNEDVLKDADVDVNDLTTFSGFLDSCSKLRDAGYSPLATDNSVLYPGWTLIALGSMLLNDEYAAANTFGPDGEAGEALPLTVKSLAHAYLTGETDMTADPAFAAMLESLKELYDECATENWSGIQSQGAFSGGTDFVGGTAGFAWGTNFSSSALADVEFSYGTLPFPALSQSDSEFASGDGAEFGVNNGGTAYMIPAYIEGKQREAAVRFLQYVSSPKVKEWLDATNSISALDDVESPNTLAALAEGPWALLPPSGQTGGFYQGPAAIAGQNPYEGYLIGSVDLDAALASLQENAVAWAKESAETSDWTEDWATQ